MKLVLDANVLISALMRDSVARALVIHPELEFVMPEHALDETLRHLPGIAARMCIPAEQARVALELLLSNVQTMAQASYVAFMPRAEDLVRDIDPDDAPLVALALATGCPLWTRDKALLGMEGITTRSTTEIAKLLGPA